MKNSYNSITPLQTIQLKMVKGGSKRGQLYGNRRNYFGWQAHNVTLFKFLCIIVYIWNLNNVISQCLLIKLIKIKNKLRYF